MPKKEYRAKATTAFVMKTSKLPKVIVKGNLYEFDLKKEVPKPIHGDLELITVSEAE